jgi:gluconate:H+ symporter, GntP family
MNPLIILSIGIATIIVLIAVFRMNAFVALITSAILVSLLAPGPLAEKISRVALAFGKTAGGIGIVIALAVIIGKCMMDSGAADRIVRAFLSLLGEKRSSTALMASGFVLSIPVFFDTVFYLLVPLAKSLHRRTGKRYLGYPLAIVAGGVITHALVPPTPGPLMMASELGIDIGVMILVGSCMGIPAAVIGLLAASWIDRHVTVSAQDADDSEKDLTPIDDARLPGLGLSLAPILLPVVLVATHTIVDALAKAFPDVTWLTGAIEYTAVIGNVNLAMLISAAIAMGTLKFQRLLSNHELGQVVETSLMSGGMIVLITAAGGAFGAMLKAAEINKPIEAMLPSGSGGLVLLGLGAIIAVVMKTAQGSSTVSMMTSSSMIAGMIPAGSSLGFHPVYLATAIGGGAMIGSWMNDSGFWIFVKIMGLSETEGLKTWTVMLAILGVCTVTLSFIMARMLPNPLFWLS